jgi:hypothetical protein
MWPRATEYKLAGRRLGTNGVNRCVHSPIRDKKTLEVLRCVNITFFS